MDMNFKYYQEEGDKYEDGGGGGFSGIPYFGYVQNTHLGCFFGRWILVDSLKNGLQRY